MNRPRLIPIMLIDKGDLIKTIMFDKYVYLGDPINALKIFNEKEVDELCIIDRSASENGINFKLLKEMADEAFMPLSYGGGIKSVNDAKKIINIGFEKIVINEATYNSFQLVKDISDEVGRQSVVVSIDYKLNLFHKRQCCYHNCKKRTTIDPLDHALKAINYGAGELIVTSVDHEGKMQGFDYDFIEKLCKKADVPIIAHGGAGDLQHISKVIHQHGASAVAVGSLFVFYGKKKGVLINYPDFQNLIDKGVYTNEKMY